MAEQYAPGPNGSITIGFRSMDIHTNYREPTSGALAFVVKSAPLDSMDRQSFLLALLASQSLVLSELDGKLTVAVNERIRRSPHV
jgi:hypothetical protein